MTQFIKQPDCRVADAPRNDAVKLPYTRHCLRSNVISLFEVRK